MALSFPALPSNGQIYTDPNGISWRFDGVKWDTYTASGYKAFSGVKLALETDHVLTTDHTFVDFDSASIDTDSYFSVNNPSRVTVNTSAFYRVNISVYSGSNGSSYNLSIKKNGSTTLASVVIAPNQYTNYDEIIELFAGDYVELYANEATSTGTLLTTSFIEVTRMGAFAGTAISSPESFSGVRGTLTSAFATTTTPTAISWDDTEFNQNANAAGDLYWNVNIPSVFTIGVNGYYRVKGVITVSSTDLYTIELRKNGTAISSITVNPNGYAQIDETFQLSSIDSIQLYVTDTQSTGSILATSYLEIIRVGV